jgi:hypothetical protein
MYSSDIKNALRDLDRGAFLDPVEVPDNPWFALIGTDLWTMCQESLDKPVGFTFNLWLVPQACAMYEHRVVVVSAQMFNMLCHIAERVVAMRAYPHVGDVQAGTWTPDSQNSFRLIREALGSRPFSWSEARASDWGRNPSRRALFFYVLLVLARFVVLHELGHIWHEHGARTKDPRSFEIDEMAGSTGQLAQGQALASQARELVADDFALSRLWKIQERELVLKADTEFLKTLAPQLLDTRKRRHDFLLQMIHLYFTVMDRLDWRLSDLSTLSHPPAPMRLFALHMQAATGGFLKTSKRSALQRAAKFLMAADALPCFLFNRYPSLWQVRGDVSAFSRQYAEIYPELQAWQRPRSPSS